MLTRSSQVPYPLVRCPSSVEVTGLIWPKSHLIRAKNGRLVQWAPVRKCQDAPGGPARPGDRHFERTGITSAHLPGNKAKANAGFGSCGNTLRGRRKKLRANTTIVSQGNTRCNPSISPGSRYHRSIRPHSLTGLWEDLYRSRLCASPGVQLHHEHAITGEFP